MILTRVVQALAVVVLAGGAGFFAYRLTSRSTTTITAASTATTPTPQTETPPPTPREIPEVVPELAMTDGAGVRRKLSEWKGRPVVINFWATWCEPCRREIPLLLKLRREHAADGLEVVGIAVDSRDAVLKYARDMHIDYPVLIGEQEGLQAVQAFGMETVLPFSVFADSQGRIVTLKVGELHADEAAFILARVQDVESGRLGLAMARRQVSDEIAKLAAERARSSAPGDAATH